MTVPENPEVLLKKAISRIGSTSHGNDALNDLATLYKTPPFNKTALLIELLKGFLLSEPVLWEDVAQTTWPEEKLRQDNHFYFLQGDLLRTEKIVTVDQARSSHTYTMCLVRQPTCELVRGRNSKGFAPPSSVTAQPSRLFRVSPAVPVRLDDQNSKSPRYESFRAGLRFASHRFFAMPPLNDDESDILGYVALLEQPYFLREDDAEDACVLASLTVPGWHLFGGVIQKLETRANLFDEISLRKNPYKD